MDILFLIQDYALLAWNSNFAGFLRFLAMVYTIVLIVDLLLILFLRDIAGNYIQVRHGADMPSSYKGRLQKRWKKIETALASGIGTQYKVAILEADTIADETLSLAKLAGSNMAERLSVATEYQVEQKDRLLWAHEVRNNIVRDETFSVDKELAEKAIGVYREFLKSWEVL